MRGRTSASIASRAAVKSRVAVAVNCVSKAFRSARTFSSWCGRDATTEDGRISNGEAVRMRPAAHGSIATQRPRGWAHLFIHELPDLL